MVYGYSNTNWWSNWSNRSIYLWWDWIWGKVHFFGRSVPEAKNQMNFCQCISLIFSRKICPRNQDIFEGRLGIINCFPLFEAFPKIPKKLVVLLNIRLVARLKAFNQRKSSDSADEKKRHPSRSSNLREACLYQKHSFFEHRSKGGEIKPMFKNFVANFV